MESGSWSIGTCVAGVDHGLAGGEDPSVCPMVTTFTFDVTPGNSGCYYAKLAEGSGYAGSNIVGSTMSVDVTWLSGPDSRFDSLVPCPPPLAGQGVTEQGFPGDGSTTAGTASVPFEPNSLEVFVGGVHVTPTETDPTTLPVAPPAGITPVLHFIATGADFTGTYTPPVSDLEIIPDAFLPAAGSGSSGGTLWRPVMVNDPGIVTTHGLPVYVPWVTVDGNAIMALS
jgi:hypothetical protein